MLRDDTPEQLATRDTRDDLMAAVANTRDFNPEQTIQARNWFSELASAVEKFILRDVSPGELGARDGLNDFANKYLNSRKSGPDKLSARDVVDDFMATVLNTRDFNPEQAMQARNWFSELASAVENFILRDVTPDELAARDGLNDFVGKYLNSRESGPDHLRDFDPEQTLQARNWFSEFASAMENFILRDVTTDELGARDDLDDFIDFLNSRESDPQPEVHARSTADGPSKTVARDAVADNFINALLKSRDSSGAITAEDLLALASLASRALDDLD
jgi:hypothetical protein